MSNSVGTVFLSSAIKRLRYYKLLGERTFEQLEEKDFLYQPNAASNSIAMIIQHLHGNMLSRWTNFLTEDGEKDWRKRDEEFGVIQYSKVQLLDKWEKGWACFLDTLESLTEADLLKTITIRQEPLIVIDAINRQLAHYPYHVGQIVYIGRMLKDQSWKSLSIEPGKSAEYNASEGIKDPANAPRI
ncbi:DUF1572 domain-containing protein [Paraflavitalea soli]|uniref:DUF1572 domain-containing protein n=1 Tax=Paraflavitalea soli TaxID=2315862 RepID=A0A3B7MWI6_9BACT|nr:DUF1572 family protein [Paraflavitalea soli]AXY78307.1 DUF1572 domain-containing protein [Paraflavitalea soli]